MEKKKALKIGIVIAALAITAGLIITLICVLVNASTAFGQLEVYAGNGSAGAGDGSALEATFNMPNGLLITSQGIVVADSGNGLIRYIISEKGVVTAAGNLTQTNGFGKNAGGYVDGKADEAVLGSVEYMCEFNGLIYFTDSVNRSIRVYDGKEVKTFSTCSKVEGYPESFAEKMENPDRTVSLVSPSGIVADGKGDIFVADTGHNTIIKIDTEGNCSLFAGVPGETGHKDGSTGEATFCEPVGLAYANGILYVTDSGNNLVRKIENGTVSTVAGNADTTDEITGKPAGGNAVGTETKLFRPTGICFSNGIIFVADSGNNCVKAILSDGTSVLAFGDKSGFKIGEGTNALMNNPTDVKVVDGLIYVADSGNNAIRKATVDFSKLSTTKIKNKEPSNLKARQVVITSVAVAEGNENNSYILRGAEKISAYEGMRLTAGDVIVSENGNSVIFTIDSDKTVRLEPCSEMRLSAVNNKQMSLVLDSGSYGFVVEKPLSATEKMDFVAGGTTMSVRGTAGLGVIRIGVKSSVIYADSDSLKNGFDALCSGKIEKTLTVPTVSGVDSVSRFSEKPGCEIALSSGKVDINTLTDNVNIVANESAGFSGGTSHMGDVSADIADALAKDIKSTDASSVTGFNLDKIKLPDGVIVNMIEEAPCTHDWVLSDSTESTCVKEGRNVFVCKLCAEEKTETAALKAHAFDAKVADAKYLSAAATCKASAVYFVSCSVCGEKGSATFESGTPAAHTPGQAAVENKKESTCTEKGGYDSVVYCTVCKSELSRTHIESELLAHTFEEKVSADTLKTAASCNTKAVYYKSCACGEKSTETFVSGKILGHSYTNYVSNKDASCTVDGTKTAKCDRCKAENTITDVNSKLGHIYEHHAAVEPTCEKGGSIEYYKCTRCQRYYKSNTPDAEQINGSISISRNYFHKPESVYLADGKTIDTSLLTPAALAASGTIEGTSYAYSVYVVSLKCVECKKKVEEKNIYKVGDIVDELKVDAGTVTGSVVEYDVGKALKASLAEKHALNIAQAPEIKFYKLTQNVSVEGMNGVSINKYCDEFFTSATAAESALSTNSHEVKNYSISKSGGKTYISATYNCGYSKIECVG